MSNKVRKLQDDTLYCQRCGISFIWSLEERKRQTVDGPAPSMCPGCRVLLPPPGRERGLVKWYNVRKRYGFIVRQREPDVFLPGLALTGQRIVQTGDLVEFAVIQSERGPAADDVHVLAQT
jgi:CspA family cold shock protein